jgi:Na+/proline symporter
MKTLKFTVYLLYKYYSKGGTRDIPYASATLLLTFMGLIHVYQFLLLINRMDLVPTDGSQAKIGNFLQLGFFILPIALLLIFGVKKSEIESANYTPEKVKRGYIFFILYLVVTFAILLFLIYFQKGKLF